MTVRTKIVTYVCRSCNRSWDTKPVNVTVKHHIDWKNYQKTGLMHDCKKPNVVKIVYVAQEITPI